MSGSLIAKNNAAWARAHLGMSRGEFLALTPNEFYAIVHHYRLKQRREDSWLAKLCWVISTSAGAKLAPKERGKQKKPDPDAIPPEFFAPWYVPPITKRRRSNPINDLIALLGPDRIIDNRKKK